MALPSPNITLTGSFADTEGNVVNGGTLTIALVNYGSNLPILAGSAILATLTQTVTISSSTNTFSVQLYGNDQISPVGTFYQITYPTGGLNSAVKNYSLTGVGTFDLSNLVPLNTPITPPVTPGQTLASPFTALFNQFLTGMTTAGQFTSAVVSTPIALIDNQHPNIAVTGIGAGLALFVVTIGANVMAAGKGIVTRFTYQHTTGSASVAYTLSYAGNTVGSWSSASSSQTVVTITVLNNPGATNAQLVTVDPIISGTTIVSGTAINNVAVNSASSQTIIFSFNVANTDQVTKFSTWTQLIQ